MRMKAVAQTIESLFVDGVATTPIMLQGKSGIGKSQVGVQVANRLGVEYLDIRLNMYRPEDMSFPIPDLKSKTVEWVQSLLPRKKDWVGFVNLEELGGVHEDMQKPCFQLLCEGTLGNYVCPPGMQFLATTNRLEDNAGVREMLAPLRNRMLWLDVEVCFDDWKDHAYSIGVDNRIIGFHNFTKGTHLHSYTDKVYQTQFATPRSWVGLSKILNRIPKHSINEVVMGMVGDAGAEFLSYLPVADEMPDPDEVLENPGTCEVPDRIDVLYVLCSALVAMSKTASRKQLEAMFVFAMRLPSEVCAAFGRDLAVTQPESIKTKASNAWVQRFSSIVWEM